MSRDEYTTCTAVANPLSTVRRICLDSMLGSETWSVIPIVKARVGPRYGMILSGLLLEGRDVAIADWGI